MALKRLPKNLTFEAVRNQPSPLATGNPKTPDALEEKSETPKDKDDSPAAASEQEREVPPPEVRAEKASETLEGGPSPKQTTETPAVDPSSQPAEPDPAKQPSPNRIEGETIKLKARIAPPADGVSPLFDSVKAAYDEKAAFKHLITVALKSYEDALISGDERAQEEQPSFASHPPSKVVFPSRVVSRSFYDAAKAVFDSLEIMGSTAFGTVVMRNAIGWYVTHGSRKK